MDLSHSGQIPGRTVGYAIRHIHHRQQLFEPRLASWRQACESNRDLTMAALQTLGANHLDLDSDLVACGPRDPEVVSSSVEQYTSRL
jgi:hypothetical protein